MLEESYLRFLGPENKKICVANWGIWNTMTVWLWPHLGALCLEATTAHAKCHAIHVNLRILRALKLRGLHILVEWYSNVHLTNCWDIEGVAQGSIVSSRKLVFEKGPSTKVTWNSNQSGAHLLKAATARSKSTGPNDQKETKITSKNGCGSKLKTPVPPDLTPSEHLKSPWIDCSKVVTIPKATHSLLTHGHFKNLLISGLAPPPTPDIASECGEARVGVDAGVGHEVGLRGLVMSTTVSTAKVWNGAHWKKHNHWKLANYQNQRVRRKTPKSLCHWSCLPTRWCRGVCEFAHAHQWKADQSGCDLVWRKGREQAPTPQAHVLLHGRQAHGVPAVRQVRSAF